MLIRSTGLIVEQKFSSILHIIVRLARLIDMKPKKKKYRIYSIKRPGRLFNLGPSGWALIRGGRLFEAGRLLN